MATAKKTVHVRDITVGVFVIVLGLFLYYFSWAMTNYIPLLDFIAAMVLMWIGRVLFFMGYHLVSGIDVDISP